MIQELPYFQHVLAFLIHTRSTEVRVCYFDIPPDWTWSDWSSSWERA